MPVGRIIIWGYRVAIPTYVGNDNSTVAYQVDSSNTVTKGTRLNGFLESNRGELERERTDWMSGGYIHGGFKYIRWANKSDV